MQPSVTYTFMYYFFLFHPVQNLTHPKNPSKLCRFAILRIYAFQKCILLCGLDENFLSYNKIYWYSAYLGQIAWCDAIGSHVKKHDQLLRSRGKNTSFVVLAQECFCLFCVYPEWPLKYRMVLCSLRDSKLPYSQGIFLLLSKNTWNQYYSPFDYKYSTGKKKRPN